MIKLINDNYLNIDYKHLINYKSIAIITDIPYGTIKGSTWDYPIDLISMWEWVEDVSKIIDENLMFISTASQPFTSKLIMSNLKHYKYNWVWNKKLAGNGMLAKKQPLKIHEDIVVFGYGRTVYNPQMTTGRPRKKMVNVDNAKGVATYESDISVDEYYNDQYYPQSIIEFSVASMRGKNRHHLAEKPVELYEYLINTYTSVDTLVLDICMGSGTTCIAAHNVGRDCVGIEIDTDIFNTAKFRLDEKGIPYEQSNN